MPPSLKDQVENSLRDIRYHPDFVGLAEEELDQTIARFTEAGSPESMKSEVYSYACDATLMKEKYFRGRLEFLSRLIALLGERPETKLDVAEDGCGSGVDLHVVHALLADKVSLTGIDKNFVSLRRAQSRVPGAVFLADFTETQYDVIYSDFVSIDSNMIWEIASRGERSFRALRSPGVILQNAEMQLLGLYIDFFGGKLFKVIPPELLATIDGGPDCYFCRFEKSS